jgi:hypothetical protein
MAVLAISVLGAVAGKAIGIGASLGWAIGSFVSNWLFAKGSKVEGPRLTDLTVQSAAEGAPIPIIYGSMRVAGQMIWTSGIQETKTKTKKGGKGMGGKSTTVTYSYKSNFAIAFCERTPTEGAIAGFRKIWADGKLIYNSSSSVSAATLYASNKATGVMQFYLGSYSQSADPTIQAAIGAADTPAYRGVAYIVFKDFQLADYGNRIPNITVEVVTAGTGTFPRKISSFSPTINTRKAEIRDGLVLWSFTNTVDSDLVPTDPQFPMYHKVSKLTLDGVNLGSETYRVASNNGAFTNLSNIGGISGRADYACLDDPSSADLGIYYRGDHRVNLPVIRNPAGTSGAGLVSERAIYWNSYTYFNQQGENSLSHYNAGIICRWTGPDNGSPAKSGSAFFWQEGVHKSTGDHAPTYKFSLGGDGKVYATFPDSGPATRHVYVFAEQSMAAIESYDWPATEIISTDNPALIVDGNRMMVTASDGVGGWTVKCFDITRGNPGTLTKVGVNLSGGTLSIASDMYPIGGGLALRDNGVYSMYPPLDPSAVTVQTVVDAICERCGITAGMRNTAALTQTLDGYVIGRHVSGRAAIEPLMAAYFFDAVESDATIKFVNRGGSSVATFTENDLGFGSDANALMRGTRMLEFELPIQVNISYHDKDNDYQPGSQTSRRLTSPTKHVVDIELPLALSSLKAAQISEVLMLNGWEERMQYEFQATRKHAHIEPTDVVTLPNGALVRVVSSEYVDNGIVKFEALVDASAHYSPVAVGNDAGLVAPQEVPIGGHTELITLDFAPFDVQENRSGMYIATVGFYSGWRGAEILTSNDQGTTYESIAATTKVAIIGRTTTVLQAAANVHQFDPHATVTVTLNDTTNTLSSITDDQVLAGGNLCAIKNKFGNWEILQFGVAILVSTGTYTLTRFMRGRFGTEAHATDHLIDGAFLMINEDTIGFIDLPKADINIERHIKASTFGETYLDAPGQTFTNTGNSQRPLAPLHAAGNANLTTGLWEFKWVRRARLDFWWSDFVDMALDEDTEEYLVQILDSNNVVLREITTTTQSATYTSAEQTIDFGKPQGSLSWQVCQRSAQVGNGHFAKVNSSAPAFGPWSGLVKAYFPELFVYTWTSPTVINDESIYNNDTGTFVGTKTVNLSPSPIVSDAGNRYVNFNTGRAVITDAAQYKAVYRMTVGIWVKTSSATSQCFIAKGSNSGTSSAFYLAAFDNGTDVYFSVQNANGDSINAIQAGGAGGFNNGQWKFLVGVADQVLDSGVAEIETRLYINGVLEDTGNYGAAVQANQEKIITSDTFSMSIGAFSGGTNPVVGDIGPAFFLKDVALTDAQILALYNAAIAA